jgi:glycine oxidase
MERWWGFRPCTPDGGPLLGESPIPGLWLATGHHRNGVLLAAITTALIADGVAAEAAAGVGARRGSPAAQASERSDWLQAFGWRRFRTPG